MKHVFVVETADTIAPSWIDAIREELERSFDDRLQRDGEDKWCRVLVMANQSSAIRGVYKMFVADEDKSPDQLGSAK